MSKEKSKHDIRLNGRGGGKFYSMSFLALMVTMAGLLKSQVELADSALVNGHDPALATPCELGWTGEWTARRGLDKIPPHPGYSSR